MFNKLVKRFKPKKFEPKKFEINRAPIARVEVERVDIPGTEIEKIDVDQNNDFLTTTFRDVDTGEIFKIQYGDHEGFSRMMSDKRKQLVFM